MAANVEKHCMVVWQVKLQVKIRFKTFYQPLELQYSSLALNSTTSTAYFARNLCIFYQQARSL